MGNSGQGSAGETGGAVVALESAAAHESAQERRVREGCGVHEVSIAFRERLYRIRLA